mmetsp:Transcript_6839/g.23091  ORF Transcript_6839/g.23091 Transcript_6839/m.23091 type:complete len:242 (+) Transcript_6839:376-1101(+)
MGFGNGKTAAQRAGVAGHADAARLRRLGHRARVSGCAARAKRPADFDVLLGNQNAVARGARRRGARRGGERNAASGHDGNVARVEFDTRKQLRHRRHERVAHDADGFENVELGHEPVRKGFRGERERHETPGKRASQNREQLRVRKIRHHPTRRVSGGENNRDNRRPARRDFRPAVYPRRGEKHVRHGVLCAAEHRVRRACFFAKGIMYHDRVAARRRPSRRIRPGRKHRHRRRRRRVAEG